MIKLHGLKVIENSALPPGWVVALSGTMAVAAHPDHAPMRFNFNKPELGWQIIGED